MASSSRLTDTWRVQPTRTAPTYLVNTVIQPGGYMSDWMKANGATKTLTQSTGRLTRRRRRTGTRRRCSPKPDQLITNTKDGVRLGGRDVDGSRTVDCQLRVDDALLNPTLAAEMPAKWAPVPSGVVQAIHDGGRQGALQHSGLVLRLTGSPGFGEYRMRPRLAKMPCRTCNRWSPGLPSNVSTGVHVIWTRPSPTATEWPTVCGAAKGRREECSGRRDMSGDPRTARQDGRASTSCGPCASSVTTR